MATLVNTVATLKQKIKELIDLSYFLKKCFSYLIGLRWINGPRVWNSCRCYITKNDTLTTSQNTKRHVVLMGKSSRLGLLYSDSFYSHGDFSDFTFFILCVLLLRRHGRRSLSRENRDFGSNIGVADSTSFFLSRWRRWLDLRPNPPYRPF